MKDFIDTDKGFEQACPQKKKLVRVNQMPFMKKNPKK